MMPFRSTSRTERHAARHLRVAAAVASSLFLIACQRTDHAQEAITSARTRLAGLSAGGGSPLPSMRRAKEYREILKALGAVGDAASADQTCAASALAARANAGLGEVATVQAGEQESRFLADLSVARSVLDQWISQNSMADALAHYDPAGDLASIDRQVATRAVEARNATAERDAIARTIEGFKAAAESEESKARAIRDADSAARATYATMTQSAKADALTGGAAKRRTADAHEREASLARAEIARLEPQLAERTRLVDRLRTQQTLLRKAKEDIQARADTGRVQAASARGEGAQTGMNLDKGIASLVAARESLAGPTQEALKSYAAATAAAKKSGVGAVGPGRTAASVGAGSYEQSRGDVLAGKARSLAAFAALLEGASQTTPPLPGAEAYKKKAEAARAELDSVRKDAKAAYTAAAANYKSSGGSADIKPRLEALEKRLTDLARLGETPEPAAEQPPPAEPAPAKPGPGEPAPPAEDAEPAGTPEGANG